MSDPKFLELARNVALKANGRNEHPAMVLSNALRKAKDDKDASASLPVPPGNQLYWRLNQVVLLDNFDGIFDNKNEIHIIAVTIDSDAEEPIKFQTPNAFPGIRKGDRLPIGDAGLGMYLSKPKAFPDYLGLNLLIVEDDQEIRNAGKVISQVREMSEFKTILTAAKTLAAAANPTYGTLIELGDVAVGLIAKLMEQNKDDIVAYFAATYTLAFDNMGLGKHTFFQADRARVQYEILAKT